MRTNENKERVKKKKKSFDQLTFMKKFKFALNEAKEFLYSFFFLPLQKYNFDVFFPADTESSGLAMFLLLDVPLASESGR